MGRQQQQQPAPTMETAIVDPGAPPSSSFSFRKQSAMMTCSGSGGGDTSNIRINIDQRSVLNRDVGGVRLSRPLLLLNSPGPEEITKGRGEKSSAQEVEDAPVLHSHADDGTGMNGRDEGQPALTPPTKIASSTPP